MADETKTPPERLAFEKWAEQLGTPDWALAAAQQKHKWPKGQEMTRAAYTRALRETTGEVIR